ncbi:hypothetical protein MKX03_001000, partial [Papaver bracteatum]
VLGARDLILLPSMQTCTSVSEICKDRKHCVYLFCSGGVALLLTTRSIYGAAK